MSESSYNYQSILEEFLYRLISRIEERRSLFLCPYMDDELREWMANNRCRLEDRELRKTVKLELDSFLDNRSPVMVKALLEEATKRYKGDK